MSSEEHEPTNRPIPDAQPEALGYMIGVGFAEPMKLIRQRGMEFGAKLSAHINPRVVDLQENSWTFVQPLGDSPDGIFRVVIQNQTIELEAKHPHNKLEWVENIFGIILKEFQKTFKPAALISSVARIIKTVPVNGDARTFLLENVVHLPVKRLDPLHRPIFVFGLKMGMPPFSYQDPAGGEPIEKEWAADVKIESLATDVHKVYLDATGQWPVAPKVWNDEATDEVVQRLATLNEFLEKDVLGFLNGE